jgi:hypothetical protein
MSTMSFTEKKKKFLHQTLGVRSAISELNESMRRNDENVEFALFEDLLNGLKSLLLDADPYPK